MGWLVEHATGNVTECAAFGAALLAGVGIGCFGDLIEPYRATVRLELTSSPAAEHRAVYDRNYRINLR